MQCRDFRELADAYLDEELLVETSHEVLRHLEQCAACRHELAARREMRVQLRRGFLEQPEYQMPPAFATRMRARLHEAAHPPRRVWWGSPAGAFALAACLLCAGFIGWRWLRPAPTADPVARATPDATPDSHTAHENLLTEVSRKAAGVHNDCALEHNLAEPPITLTEAARNHDAAYHNLTQTLAASLKAGNYQLLDSHACVWQGRRFAHLVIRYQGKIVSLLVTDNKMAAPQNVNDQAQVRCNSLQGVQLSCFETARHIVLVVSALPEQQNLAIARNLSPAILQHLVTAEKAS